MRVAGFDIGTNSVRVLIADADATGRIKPGVRIGFATRLGEGLAHTGRVSDEALERTARVLGKSARLARALGTSGMRAGATHVLRVASNSGHVLESLEEAAGLRVKILTPEEEAYYAYLGAFSGEGCIPDKKPGDAGRRVMGPDEAVAGSGGAEGEGAIIEKPDETGTRPTWVAPGQERRSGPEQSGEGPAGGPGQRVSQEPQGERRLLIDIGGGSVTLTQGEGFDIKGSTTLPIGCVTLTEKFLSHDPPSGQELTTLREHVLAELKFLSLRPEPGDSVIAVGGAATCMAAVSLELPFYDSRRVDGHILGADEMERSTAALSRMTKGERERIGCVGRRRAEIAVAGAVLLTLLTKHLGLHAIVISIRGLRYGLALEAATA
jgi:exopolyphosphatase/guanosine-5'-triphosphate,3'-diphosphate pyrophosphatase